MDSVESIVSGIREKRREYDRLLAALELRPRVIQFIRSHGIAIGENDRFTFGAIGRGGKIVAFRLNGKEHRLETPIPSREWTLSPLTQR
tara:strand:- start:518 stop:784 length:267 start_codon:yes stop_codon:yes gene_type:complete